MAITTVDGLIAGFQPPQPIWKAQLVGTVIAEAIGIPHSLWYESGLPGPAAVPAPGVNGAALTANVSGQIPWTNPVSGNGYLARWSATGTVAGSLFLIDRLWHNSGLNVTLSTAQSITMSALPARDNNGTTNGLGVQFALEVSTNTGNAAANTSIVINYTNSDGTAGRTGSIPSFPATALKGTFTPFSLAAGDLGIRSVQGITLGTTLSAGAIHLIAYRVIAQIDLVIAGSGDNVDPFRGGLPRIYNDSVLQLLYLPTATPARTEWMGTLTWAHG